MSVASAVAVAALRVAVLVSSSHAPGQSPLRYAKADVEQMAQVLEELGGVAAQDVMTLHDPSLAELRATLARAEGRAGKEGLLLVYFSGHADGDGLLLGRERMPYVELRERLDHSPARVRLALLDSCHSGGALGRKGGLPGPAYDVRVLEQRDVTGAAIIAASAASEAAQESSEVDGSYFTHHLLSGLRGAADADGNRQVTLSEAYRYAYSRTVSATAATLLGPQHPGYDFRLSGTGDVVLTRVDGSGAVLVLPQSPGATYFILDERDNLAAEVSSAPGRRIALPPGRYQVAERRGGRVRVSQVVLRGGAEATFDENHARTVDSLTGLRKGGSASPFAVFLGGGLATLSIAGTAPSFELGLSLRYRGDHWVMALRGEYGWASVDRGAFAYQFRRLGTDALLLRPVVVRGMELQMGASVGLSRITQTFAPSTWTGTCAAARAVLALEIPLWRPLALQLLWEAGAQVARIDGALRAKPDARATFAVGVEF